MQDLLNLWCQDFLSQGKKSVQDSSSTTTTTTTTTASASDSASAFDFPSDDFTSATVSDYICFNEIELHPRNRKLWAKKKTALKLKCTLQNLLEKEVFCNKSHTPTITNEETLKNKTNKYTTSLVHQLPFWSKKKTNITQWPKRSTWEGKKIWASDFCLYELSLERYACMYICIHVCMYVCMYV